MSDAHEILLGPEDLIVSKTDPGGRIQYANDVFQRISGYSEAELRGKPHSIIRHPDMPRAVFRVLWDTIESGGEIFAYVKNRARNGDFYWVFAHVTPTFDRSGRQIVGYHSNRRAPSRQALATIEPVYADLCAVEAGYRNAREAATAGAAALQQRLADLGVTYDEFIWSLAGHHEVSALATV